MFLWTFAVDPSRTWEIRGSRSFARPVTGVLDYLFSQGYYAAICAVCLVSLYVSHWQNTSCLLLKLDKFRERWEQVDRPGFSLVVVDSLYLLSKRLIIVLLLDVQESQELYHEDPIAFSTHTRL